MFILLVWGEEDELCSTIINYMVGMMLCMYILLQEE